MAQDPRSYARFRALADAPSFADLDDARRRVVDNALRDFRLGGADLGDADKARFKAVQEDLASLSAKFDDNVLDSEKASPASPPTSSPRRERLRRPQAATVIS